MLVATVGKLCLNILAVFQLVVEIFNLSVVCLLFLSSNFTFSNWSLVRTLISNELKWTVIICSGSLPGQSHWTFDSAAKKQQWQRESQGPVCHHTPCEFIRKPYSHQDYYPCNCFEKYAGRT